MIQRTPRSTRTHTLIPSTTLFRSRPDHDPHAIDRHGPPMSGRRVYVQHDRLRQWHDECTGHALEQPKRDHLGQGCGDAAQHGCNDEQDNRKEKEVARSHRSEEHTSELQSLMRTSYAVFRLKKNKTY